MRTDHHLEQVIRGVSASVLVATVEAFAAPERVVMAYDGSPGSRRALARMARHPLVAGLPVHVVMVAADGPATQQALKEAQRVLADAGIDSQTEQANGEPQQVLPELVRRQAPAMLVMGAFGHSRLRQLLFGSTTAQLLRLSEVPVLVLR
jgi:nucleotide-binding universal stress UspA family protein